MKGAPQILGPDGRVVNAERVRLEKQQRFNPLANWTPDVLTRQLVEFAQGRIASLAWVMEWLEQHDDTLSCVAPKAKAAVSRHGYDVVFVDGLDKADKAAAEDQRGYLEHFYANLETGDAIEAEESGGMRLLIQQVMDGYGKKYAVHHIIWQPGKDGLTARLVKVPLWFFENTTGRLRFLRNQWDQYGVELDDLGGRDAWMISRGRGVMLAGAIARMFKQIPLQDWLTYCDRHGMPAFLGKTAAAFGSDGWNQMAQCVASLGAEFGGVINQSDAVDVLTLTGQGQIPYDKLVDRMDRAQVMLWRGGDLSTISRADGVGSNPQQEEADELDADNAAWVEETLNAQLSRRALRYRFGKDARILAKIRLRTKARVNTTEDLAKVEAALKHGVRVSKQWFVSYFGVTEADEGEEALEKPAAPTFRPGQPPAPGQAPAADPENPDADPDADPTADPEADANNTASPDFRRLLEDSLARAVGVRAEILAPLGPVFDRLAAGVHDSRISDAAWLQLFEEAADSLPELFDPAQADALAEELNAAMGTAVVQGVRDSIRENTAAKDPS